MISHDIYSISMIFNIGISRPKENQAFLSNQCFATIRNKFPEILDSQIVSTYSSRWACHVKAGTRGKYVDMYHVCILS